jgi:serine/threonine protein phosphatase PrpC
VEANSVFNVQLSGTTFTSGFFNGNQLFTCNVGDSRVILISVDSENKVKTKQLTTDHKPDNPCEKARIQAVGGKVAQAQDWRGRFSGP